MLPIATLPYVPSSEGALRVLLVAERHAEATRITSNVRDTGARVSTRWVNTLEACRTALAEGEWDAAITPWPLSRAAAPLREDWEALPVILVAEQIEPEVLAESHELGAIVCRFEGCRAQLAKVLGRIARGASGRARGRAQRAFEREQSRILEQVARGAQLTEVLEQIVRVIEQHIEGSCSILLLDREHGVVRHGAAPSLPADYIRAIDGSPIGPAAGSCGTAMYRAERVVVRDVSTHPYWAEYKHLALPHGLLASWSSPIFSPSREVLGSFAVYHREPRDPTEEELRVIDVATALAAIAIERDRSEQALRASEARYRQLIDTSHEGVVMLDFDARVGFANPRAAAILGYDVSDLVGRNVKDLLDRSEVARIATLLQQRADAGGQQFELHMRTRTGGDLWVILAASPVLNAARKMVGMLGMITDISERKHVEQELKCSEQRLRTIFEASAVGIALIDAETRPVKANPALERLLGLQGSELRATTLLSLVHPHDYSDFSAKKRKVDIGELESFCMEVRFHRKGGELIWARVTVSAIRAGDARLGAVVMLEDVSEGKRLEEAVRAEERLRALIYEAVSDVIYYVGVEPGERFKFLSVNPAFCVAAGLSEREIVGRAVEEVIPPEPRAKVLTNWKRAIRLRRTIRWQEHAEYRTGWKYGEVSVTPLFDATGACTNLVGTVHDVTEHMEAAAKIAEQAALLDRSRDAIIAHALDGKVRFWNEGAVRLYGHSRDEAIGRPVTELVYRDPQRHEAALAQLLQDGSWTGELIHQNKSGQELIIESSWTLLRDPDGKPEGVLAIHTDVTEKAKLKAQVVLAQRMESLGTLAGGIAHDFNNILTAIIGHLAFAMRDLPSEHPAQRRLEVVQSATARAAELVNQILTFSRRRETRRVPIRLEPVVEEALSLLRATLPTMIKFETDLRGDGIEVLADASQIHQVVMNLGTNAAHAMGSHGTLQVRLEPITLTSARADAPATLRPGRYMLLTVRDDGCGMDDATLARIFDPFFTTKDPGQGTGLGLSVVHGIVEDHGGVITVRSRPGEGTTFQIYLPAAEVGSQAPEEVAPLASLRGRGQRILCVDDEETVLALVLELLRGLGYQPCGFTDPHAAMRALAESPLSFDAVVTDFAMPQMTGTELAAAAHALRAELPVLMTSGYLRSEEAQRARRAGIHAVISKPHFVEPLAQALSELFRASEP